MLDLGQYFSSGNVRDLEAAARALRDAAASTGFHLIVGHGVDEAVVAEAFEASRRFHALPDDVKRALAMDAPPARAGEVRAGCGYLPPANRKLPARDKPNMNAAFVVKREAGPRDVTLARMPWPDEDERAPLGGYGFRAAVERYCGAMEQLALRMLPVYAVALGLAPSAFCAAFEAPLYRLRLSRYGPTPRGEFGINPHVDTSFFTILATTSAGLVVHSRARAAEGGGAGWVRAPHRDGAFVVNFGELLSQVTNEQWPATRHYAVVPPLSPAELEAEAPSAACSADDGGGDDGDFLQEQGYRYSLPFFFNATPTHRMAVLPTCTSADDPPRYPPLSYLEGQGVAQGE